MGTAESRPLLPFQPCTHLNALASLKMPPLLLAHLHICTFLGSPSTSASEDKTRRPVWGDFLSKEI